MNKTTNDRIADVIVEGLYYMDKDLHPQDAYRIAYKIMDNNSVVKKLTIHFVSKRNKTNIIEQIYIILISTAVGAFGLGLWWLFSYVF